MGKKEKFDPVQLLSSLNESEKKRLLQLILKEGKEDMSENLSLVCQMPRDIQFYMLEELFHDSSKVEIFNDEGCELKYDPITSMMQADDGYKNQFWTVALGDEEEEDEEDLEEDGLIGGVRNVINYVHAHGWINGKPKFVVFPSVSVYSMATTVQKGDNLVLEEGSVVYISDNYEVTHKPNVIPENIEPFTSMENELLKVVRIVHTVGPEVVNSLREVFLAFEEDGTTLVLHDSKGKVIEMQLCSCQNPESHDPLHIMNREN